MPTDLPRRSGPSASAARRLELAVIRLRLGVVGWRLDQARRRHDHHGVLRQLDSWAILQDQRIACLGRHAPQGLVRSHDETCARMRATLRRIDRESRRLSWAMGRMRRARSAQDRRAYGQAERLCTIASRRLEALWASL
ncbi:MAG: hypothetical protein K2X71_13015 [Methylobacterium sp.]|uniref:hypothetical protein n=1 Tax=Methylobacterium sp. TaxID=409 RepID=UPI002583A934|nr:hypothetical protein [Methylobacterium sp.]MBY0296936.1 hypothetical protein [Methylobacterium sp.]